MGKEMKLNEKLPDGWVVSSNVKRNITVHNSVERKTIIMVKTDSEWTVKGLVGFNNGDIEYPVFRVTNKSRKAKQAIMKVAESGIEEIGTVKKRKETRELNQNPRETKRTNTQEKKTTDNMNIDDTEQTTLTKY